MKEGHLLTSSSLLVKLLSLWVLSRSSNWFNIIHNIFWESFDHDKFQIFISILHFVVIFWMVTQKTGSPSGIDRYFSSGLWDSSVYSVRCFSTYADQWPALICNVLVVKNIWTQIHSNYTWTAPTKCQRVFVPWIQPWADKARVLL